MRRRLSQIISGSKASGVADIQALWVVIITLFVFLPEGGIARNAISPTLIPPVFLYATTSESPGYRSTGYSKAGLLLARALAGQVEIPVHGFLWKV